MNRSAITVSARTTLKALCTMCMIIVGMSIAGQIVKFAFGHPYVYGLVAMFDVDAEHNVPTLFSVALLLIAATLLGFITRMKAREHSPFAARWFLLAAGFVLMAFDEGAQLHELLIVPSRHALGSGHPLGIFYFAWIVPIGGLVLVLGIYFIRFVRSLPRRIGVLFVLAGAMYVGGAMGFEAIGGWYAERHGEENLTYVWIATVEETLEMLGVIVFIHALLGYIAQQYGELEVRFSAAEVARESAASARTRLAHTG